MEVGEGVVAIRIVGGGRGAEVKIPLALDAGMQLIKKWTHTNSDVS